MGLIFTGNELMKSSLATSVSFFEVICSANLAFCKGRDLAIIHLPMDPASDIDTRHFVRHCTSNLQLQSTRDSRFDAVYVAVTRAQNSSTGISCELFSRVMSYGYIFCSHHIQPSGIKDSVSTN